jgi:hypothetical protein
VLLAKLRLFLEPFNQGTVTVFKGCHTFSTFRIILDVREKLLSVQVRWKSYGIVECSVTALVSVEKLKFSDMNGCWEKVSPEAFE